MTTKELQLKLIDAINKYNKYDGDSKQYWKGVGHTYQSILVNHHQEWDAAIIQDVVW